MKRIRGKKPPLTAAGLHALRDEYTRTIEPARKGVVRMSVRENVMFLRDACSRR
jgi:hypothetical protein